MSRKMISSLVIAGLMLIAISAFAGTKDMPASAGTKYMPASAVTPAVPNPCPDGWQVKGRVTKSAEGSPVFVCVPKKPTLNCGPGTAAKILPCEVGCQPVIK